VADISGWTFFFASDIVAKYHVAISWRCVIVFLNIPLLKRRCAELGLDQKALTERLGLKSVRSVQRLLAGHSTKIATIQKLANILDVEVIELLQEDRKEAAGASDSVGTGRRALSRGPLADYKAIVRKLYGVVQLLGLPHRVDSGNLDLSKLFVPPCL